MEWSERCIVEGWTGSRGFPRDDTIPDGYAHRPRALHSLATPRPRRGDIAGHAARLTLPSFTPHARSHGSHPTQGAAPTSSRCPWDPTEGWGGCPCVPWRLPGVGHPITPPFAPTCDPTCIPAHGWSSVLGDTRRCGKGHGHGEWAWGIGDWAAGERANDLSASARDQRERCHRVTAGRGGDTHAARRPRGRWCTPPTALLDQRRCVRVVEGLSGVLTGACASWRSLQTHAPHGADATLIPPRRPKHSRQQAVPETG